MTIDVYGTEAKDRVLINAGTWGRSNSPSYSIELAALAQNEVAAICKVPRGAQVTDFRHVTDALGSNTALEFGYERVSAGTGDTDYFATVADASSASNGRTTAGKLVVDEDMYITVKNTGSGDATGTVEVIPTYEYYGNG